MCFSEKSLFISFTVFGTISLSPSHGDGSGTLLVKIGNKVIKIQQCSFNMVVLCLLVIHENILMPSS